ncbi:hypothetical protein LTR78_001273 [Recurvomyces mirabilis]|uniref:Aminoglycoside phosphotransferase domain-containing protein n=1 Tax=Recurvomyces mirabilis TaxID=574656 RepID=A0AAE0WVU2_9PEZI|nr:hypothetical protein LTR78_001273 [Recurvomyces mirabilis]KAK5161250.1 hypothetical protein LTS14_001046 [Recurvomyces mirabilis]
MPDRTPEDHPTYGVNLPDSTIRDIAALVSPDRTLERIQQLGRGESFNNRIYFLTFERACDDTGVECLDDLSTLDHVLKVSGRFWGIEKVQNEVSCLLLLEEYCPNVPAPRVIAYSEQGDTIRLLPRSSGNGYPESVRDLVHPPLMESSTKRPWILMSRCHGTTLDLSQMQGHEKHDTLQQLARYMSQWRSCVPDVQHYGNLLLPDRPDLASRAALKTFPDLPSPTVAGLLDCTLNPSATPSTRLEYQMLRLENQLAQLEATGTLAPSRAELVPLVRRFIHDIVPRLRLFKLLPQTPCFTHNDFAPRNILISRCGAGNAPVVTGIVDFEFAGFFPAEEEFTNLAQVETDWPVEAVEMLFRELEDRGVATPLHGLDGDAWEEVRTLYLVTLNIAPWWLVQGEVAGEGLVQELRAAAEKVREGIGRLTSTVETPSII